MLTDAHTVHAATLHTNSPHSFFFFLFLFSFVSQKILLPIRKGKQPPSRRHPRTHTHPPLERVSSIVESTDALHNALDDRQSTSPKKKKKKSQ
ncbi:Uncharacterized protein APZ42_021192 [Daphnia magna]|uniref:Uncharacterized protein n=1 Tax=Daphnia magna TaxID=35525 RepID=A0A0P5Z3J9_9CRUS|nr:Uncharacterized protein APZ42_021192 [Daphnia magna]